jgi:hypothetical protein
MSFNALTGTIPTEIALLSNLGLIQFDKNQLSGSIPSELCQLKSVTSIDLFIDCQEVVCHCSCYCSEEWNDDSDADIDDQNL